MNSAGISLLDVLRRRRELPLSEVVRLCGEVPRELDGRREAAEPIFLHHVLFSFQAGVDERALLETPVTDWPEFSATLAESPLEETLAQTVDRTRPEPGGGTGAAGLARLLYELLGGSQRALGTRRPPPLPALNEAGNDVLRAVLAGEGARESCAGFWERWLRACEVGVRASGWRIPRWLLSVAQPGEVLTLTPAREAGVEMALIARSVFRIGRSRSTADYPTRLLDRAGQLDEEHSVLVSRVQVLAEATPQGLTLRDGNGLRASANGSRWNGAPLSWETPTPLAVPGELVLGGVYGLRVAPQLGGPDRPAAIENHAEWVAPAVAQPALPLDFSAVIFRPLDGQRATRDAVWLGREVGFSLDRDGGFCWDTIANRSPAQFLFADGCFWLANGSLPAPAVRLNEAVLDAGQIAPLANDQTLEIGGREYRVRIE